MSPELQRRVEVEVGRYDKVESGVVFDRAEVMLESYLNWLENAPKGNGDDQQVYLAQWRALDQVRFSFNMK